MLHYITAADPAASGRGIKNHNQLPRRKRAGYEKE